MRAQNFEILLIVGCLRFVLQVHHLAALFNDYVKLSTLFVQLVKPALLREGASWESPSVRFMDADVY